MKQVHFDGETYQPELDYTRLSGQLGRVFDTMKDGEWRTLKAISYITGDPEASVSARLRDLRKQKFGGYIMETARTKYGTWCYRLLV
jgi:hypothetical protein